MRTKPSNSKPKKSNVEVVDMVKLIEDNAELTTYLTPPMTKYIAHKPTPKQQAFLWLTCPDAFYGGAAGGGKMATLDTTILTPFGYKTHESIKVNDKVNNPDGSVANVIYIHDIQKRDIYNVCFDDGTVIKVANDHFWNVWFARKGRKIKNKRTFGEISEQVVTTQQMMKWHESGRKLLIPVTQPVVFNVTHRHPILIDSYLLGVLLGDGHIGKKNIGITSMDYDSIEDTLDRLCIDYRWHAREGNRALQYTFRGESLKFYRNQLERCQLLGTHADNKFIPKQYKYADIDSRYALIQGLMDTDGYVDERGQMYYCTISKQLCDDFCFVIRSLGGTANFWKKPGRYKDDDGNIVECNTAYEIYIKHRQPEKLVTLLRKSRRLRNAVTDQMHKKIIGIEKTQQIEEMRCITVSHPNGLYLTDNFTVTHNSDALLMAALQYVDRPGYNAILMRNTYQNLSKPESLIPRSHEWLRNTDAHWDGEKKVWTFPSSATISFGYVDGPLDHFNFQSAAYQFVGIDELVQIRENQALYMFSRMRRLEYLKDVPLRFRGASNPPTAEQAERGEWVKHRYVDPKSRKKKRIFISADMNDNPYLDKVTYRESLQELDVVTRKQLEEGDWDVQVKGKMFDASWFDYVQFVPSVGRCVRSWDLAGSEETWSAWTAGAKISRVNGIFYIENIIRFKGTPGKVEAKLKATAKVDTKRVMIRLPQDPGQAGKSQVIHYTQNVLLGYNVRFVLESGDKVERALAFSSQAEAGNVKLVRGNWNKTFLDEVTIFPNCKFKDQTDACSSGIHALIAGSNNIQVGPPEIIKNLQSHIPEKASVHVVDPSTSMPGQIAVDKNSVGKYTCYW